MRILLIDNYDSFTYNLVHAVEPLVDELVVWRNNRIKLADVALFDKIIISPGPSLPEEAGQLMDIIKTYHKLKPILGVCLGFQALVEFFGGELQNLEPVRHGESKSIQILNNKSIFQGLTNTIDVGLYHSWGVYSTNIPNSLEVIAKDTTDVAMSIKHVDLPIFGVQFHPESVMTPNGIRILKNWINN